MYEFKKKVQFKSFFDESSDSCVFYAIVYRAIVRISSCSKIVLPPPHRHLVADGQIGQGCRTTQENVNRIDIDVNFRVFYVQVQFRVLECIEELQLDLLWWKLMKVYYYLCLRPHVFQLFEQTPAWQIKKNKKIQIHWVVSAIGILREKHIGWDFSWVIIMYQKVGST